MATVAAQGSQWHGDGATQLRFGQETQERCGVGTVDLEGGGSVWVYVASRAEWFLRQGECLLRYKAQHI